jgi:hypothetical protein
MYRVACSHLPDLFLLLQCRRTSILLGVSGGQGGDTNGIYFLHPRGKAVAIPMGDIFCIVGCNGSGDSDQIDKYQW